MSAVEQDLSTRLRLFSRLLGVFADQLEAGEEQDYNRLLKLKLERDSIESELGPDALDSDLAEELATEVAAAAEKISRLMSAATGGNRWMELDEGALRAARAVTPRRLKMAEYKEYEVDAASIDVRY